MSKESRQKRALNAIAVQSGFTVFIDGESFPLIKPKADYQAADYHFMDFDREVCAAGMKAFVRPWMPSDEMKPEHQISWPPMPLFARQKSDFVLVREITPGMRTRMGVNAREMIQTNGGVA